MTAARRRLYRARPRAQVLAVDREGIEGVEVRPLDGEIVRLERNGVSDFYSIMFRREWRVDVRPLWTPAVFRVQEGREFPPPPQGAFAKRPASTRAVRPPGYHV